MLGPDDGESWAAAQRELHGWLNSTDANKGRQLFKVIGKPTNRASERANANDYWHVNDTG
jgi:hypothetical protein